MSTDRDVTRIVRSWLEEGATALPDRVLDNVLDLVPATPQRRPMWPAWRSHPMNMLRLAVAAAAVVVVAIVGVNLMPDQGVGPGATLSASPTPPPSPTPRPSPTPSPSPTPLPDDARLPSSGTAMIPGTYIILDSLPLKVSVTVGDQWFSWSGNFTNGGAIYKWSADPPDGTGIVVLVVDNLYANPCDQTEGMLDPPLGPTVDDLVGALANQPRTDASDATDVSVDGFSGKYLEYTATAITSDCAVTLQRWGSSVGNREALVGEHDQVWILDVDGIRLVIDAFSFAETTDAYLAEVRAIVESIQIEP